MNNSCRELPGSMNFSGRLLPEILYLRLSRGMMKIFAVRLSLRSGEV
jgi:hypothetical protein